MTDRSHHDRSGDEALDDATVEELLGGRYDGDAPDLVAVNKLLAQVRSLGEQPAPLPSATLAQILGDAPVASGGLPTAGRRLPRDLRVGPFRGRAHRPDSTPRARRRARSRRVLTAVAAVSAVVAVAVAAGSARLLPGPTQNALAGIVRAVTPFDIPDQRNREGAVSQTPRPEAMPPSEEPAARAPGDPWLSRPAEPGTSGDRAVGPDGLGRRAQPEEVNPLPTPATTVAGGNRGSPPGVDRSVAPPPLPGHGLRAELTGATGVETAGDPDGRATATLRGNPGRDELCLALVVSGVAPVTAVHLHAEADGAGGPELAAWTEATGECATVPDELIKNIRKHPEKYSLDVHTTEFPNGALRGRLSK